MKKKKGGWEGKKNSIFVKREKRPRGEFLLGILELEKKKNTKKDKKKIFWQVMFTNWGRDREQGLGAEGPWGHTEKHSHAKIHRGRHMYTPPRDTHSSTEGPRDTPQENSLAQ